MLTQAQQFIKRGIPQFSTKAGKIEFSRFSVYSSSLAPLSVKPQTSKLQLQSTSLTGSHNQEVKTIKSEHVEWQAKAAESRGLFHYFLSQWTNSRLTKNKQKFATHIWYAKRRTLLDKMVNTNFRCCCTEVKAIESENVEWQAKATEKRCLFN